MCAENNTLIFHGRAPKLYGGHLLEYTHLQESASDLHVWQWIFVVVGVGLAAAATGPGAVCVSST
jgi:hypothetical protein